MDAQERRLRNLEKVIPKKIVDRQGVEEFVEFLPAMESMRSEAALI